MFTVQGFGQCISDAVGASAAKLFACIKLVLKGTRWEEKSRKMQRTTFQDPHLGSHNHHHLGALLGKPNSLGGKPIATIRAQTNDETCTSALFIRFGSEQRPTLGVNISTMSQPLIQCCRRNGSPIVHVQRFCGCLRVNTGCYLPKHRHFPDAPLQLRFDGNPS